MSRTKEKEIFYKLCETLPDEIIRFRIQSAGEWYVKGAYLYKWIFYICSFIGIAVPIVVTAANGLFSSEQSTEAVKVITIVGSAVTALSTAFLSFSKSHEKWTLYRNTFEKMKYELSIYQSKKSNDEAMEKLVIRIEKIMEEEHIEWMNISKSDCDKTEINRQM